MIEFKSDVKNITQEMLDGGFFEGWPKHPSPSVHLEILKSSFRAIVAIDVKTNKVVGFITAISDGVYSIYIPLLEVLPEYQGQGIGKRLLEIMFEQCKDFYMVDLLCDKELQPYYENVGMIRSQGMLLRNYHRQAGNQ
ncbi:GNAT family N-acetyltransferase [Heyndrickxia sp. NPDC080065]|uniref:GNAT family N-acetyltransferase n=1 Tax=Heyndrickxia sp. NPDC080065 TaxID=3390568 RepID=UPI003CFC41F7